MKRMGILAGYLLYLEIVSHLGCFGMTACNPVFVLPFCLTAAALGAVITGSIKYKRTVLWLWLGGCYLLYAAQIVYLGIFKQPLLLEAVFRGGGDALTNYWREALAGIASVFPCLLFIAAPLVVIGWLMHKKKLLLPALQGIRRYQVMLCGGIGIILTVMVTMIGSYVEADYYEAYTEFYDPLSVAEDLGMLTMAQRDLAVNVESLGQSFLERIEKSLKLAADERDRNKQDIPVSGDVISTGEEESVSVDESLEGITEGTTKGTEAQTQEATAEAKEEGILSGEEVDTSPNQLPIDYAYLQHHASNKEMSWLAEYIEKDIPTKKNEYSGMFEGYNLIFITAEGFSPYAVSEELTPTLYRLIHSGWDFVNYYAPLWQTSTSDGEYVNLTGLIPDGQFSMRKSGSNNMSFALPGYFAADGAPSYAYHNGKLSYYQRHLSHNNLGYVFKAAKLGDLSGAVWEKYLFPMENPDAWPASDLEMMQGTLPEYMNLDRFHIYYLTVSGHMNYNFTGNRMASKNKAAVEGLEISETAKAYIACQIELEKALEYLLVQLEAAGKLESTVICMSTDHYPYGMDEAVYEELAGRDLSENMDMYRNNLILWNVKLEENPQVIDKVCGSVDILPTLLNLFGFQYDSRLYAGRDIFSEEEGLVIFNDRSFVTDRVIYDRDAKTTTWKVTGGEETAEKEYFSQLQQEVKDRYQLSAYFLRNDYYQIIEESLPQEYRNVQANPAKTAYE